jgi:hypothetical protein
VNSFIERASPGLLWRELDLEASHAERGRQLFAGTLGQRNQLWKEFRSYIRQAKEYDDAAAHVHGPSAALLLYYMALNLAKAELLTTTPNPITGQVIRHGLTFSPTGAKTIAGDHLGVQAGVFPLLYRKRTGSPLPLKTQLRIKPMLGYIEEIGWELAQTGFMEARITQLLHIVAVTVPTLWALIAVSNGSVISNHRVTRAMFNKYFEPVAAPPQTDWRNVFAVTKRANFEGPSFYESRQKITATAPAIVGPDIVQIRNATWNNLRGYIDDGEDDVCDALLAASFSGVKLQPMPPALARYALMYYVSSLVRYKPEQLDPRVNPEQHWLLAAFVDQARTQLLRSALSGIRNVRHLFYSTAIYRS